MTGFTIVPDGRFSLAAAAGFGFGPNSGRPFYEDGRMNLGFVTDDFAGHAFVALRQLPSGAVEGTIDDATDPGVDAGHVRDQVARILSLDGSGADWAAVGEGDPVIGRLQQAHRGLRPVLFHSPYEAAAWSIISARKQRAQGAVIRNRLAAEHGRTATIGGQQVFAFPTPEELLRVREVRSLDAVRIDRLHAVARAALAGRLEPAHLLSLDPDAALAHLQELPGIGPTYSTLILLRSTGARDILTGLEPRISSYVARFYELGTAQATPTDLDRITDGWRPFRTWTSVLCRVAGDAAGIPFPNTFARR